MPSSAPAVSDSLPSGAAGPMGGDHDDDIYEEVEIEEEVEEEVEEEEEEVEEEEEEVEEEEVEEDVEEEEEEEVEEEVEEDVEEVEEEEEANEEGATLAHPVESDADDSLGRSSNSHLPIQNKDEEEEEELEDTEEEMIEEEEEEEEEEVEEEEEEAEEGVASLAHPIESDGYVSLGCSDDVPPTIQNADREGLEEKREEEGLEQQVEDMMELEEEVVDEEMVVDEEEDETEKPEEEVVDVGRSLGFPAVGEAAKGSEEAVQKIEEALKKQEPVEVQREEAREPPAYPINENTDINEVSEVRGWDTSAISSNLDILKRTPSPFLHSRDVEEGTSVKPSEDPQAALIQTNARDEKPDGNVKAAKNENKINLQTTEDCNSPSIQTASKRSRNSSPVGDETRHKKPALICEFFARGWCVKGNSCRFLHQKFPVTVDQGSKEKTEPRGHVDPVNHRALDQPVSSDAPERLKDSTILQGGLLRCSYGEENYGKPQITEDYVYSSRPTSNFSCIDRSSGTLSNELGKVPLFREEYHRDLGVRYHDFTSEKLSGHGEFSPGQYQKDAKVYQEIPKRDTVDEASISRTSFSKNSLYPEYNYNSASTATGLFRSSNYDYSCNKWTEDRELRYRQNCFPPESGRMIHEEFSGEVASSAWRTSLPLDSSWETSVPFRSSFCPTPVSKLPSGSQYDPLIDSIEPKNVGNMASASENSVVNSMPSPRNNPDPLPDGNTAGHSAHRPPSSFSQSCESMSEKTSLHRHSGYSSILVASETTLIDERGHLNQKEEKSRVLHLPDGANHKKADHSSDLRDGEEKGNDSKESRALSIFRPALIDFIKELIKPSWKDGRVSKEAHKIIVKKVVEKVLHTLKLPQVPTNTESINQYLSTSRAKLMKLVEGYVVKYAKS